MASVREASLSTSIPCRTERIDHSASFFPVGSLNGVYELTVYFSETCIFVIIHIVSQ